MDDRIPIIGQQIRDQAMEDTVLAIIGPALIGHPVIAELIRRVRWLEESNRELRSRVTYLTEAALEGATARDVQCAFDEVEPLLLANARALTLPSHPLIQQDGHPATDPFGVPLVGGAFDEHDIGCTVTIVAVEGYGFDALHGQRFEGKDKREALTKAGDAVTAFLAEMGEDE